MLSVIIPVYNVESYVDKCIESVCNQTYKELEIIIVYDESSDNSYVHCLEWSKRDKRIQLIVNKKRGGLGAARNTGLLKAGGEYVLFVDSDDWLDTQYVEILYEAMLHSGADFVSSSSYFESQEDAAVVRHGMPEGYYQNGEMRELLLCGDYVTSWKKLYRRNWLLENGLMQPELYHYEDWGAYPPMVSSAEKIYVSDIPGAYYRLERAGCLSLDNETALLRDFEKTIMYVFNYLDKNSKWEQPEHAIAFYCWRDFYVRYCANQKSGNAEGKEILNRISKDILLPKFGNFDPLIFNYIVLGSFSLRWEVQRGCVEESRVEKHFCFSSLISIFSKSLRMDVVHENRFRKAQIEQDMESDFIKAVNRANDKTLLFLDFLEERFDILELETGSYVTDSDALQESNIKEIKYTRRIKSGSEEHMNLWKLSCDRLVVVLKKYMKPNQIVLVKNRMACTYGNFNKKESYENRQEIENINGVLKKMESYFMQLMPDILVVEDQPEYIFTDRRFRLGCDPQYLNNAWYTKVGLEVFNKILQECR